MELLFVTYIDGFLHAGEHIFDENVMTGLRGHFITGKLEEAIFNNNLLSVKLKRRIKNKIPYLKLDQLV